MTKRWIFGLPGILIWLCVSCEPDPWKGDDIPEMAMTEERWTSSADLNVTIHQQGRPHQTLTSSNKDFKPSWSLNAEKITFFRIVKYGQGFHNWKTKLCVIDADGSGFRELTHGEYADFNQTWTRDGSELILFNRYAVNGRTSNDIYWIAPDGEPGDEVMLSHPNHTFEWVFSGLADGRLFIDWINFEATGGPKVRSYLMKPNPGDVGEYQEIQRPTDKLWHKLSLSPDETRVTYMLDNNGDMSSYADVVLYYADFDKERLVVENPVAITEYNTDSIEEYPRWNRDGTLIIYDSNRSGVYQHYAYRLADGVTGRLSADHNKDYQFGNFEGVPK